MGFDKLIDFILEFLKDFLPFTVVNIWEEAVLLRFGKPKKVLKPGFHPKIPFVDNPYCVTVVTTTLPTPVQSVLTKDKKQVAAKVTIKYNIEDTIPYVKMLYDAVDGISDLTQGFVMKTVNTKTWDECTDTDQLGKDITAKARAGVKKYGIYIEAVTITNFSQTPSFRMYGDKSTD